MGSGPAGASSFLQPGKRDIATADKNKSLFIARSLWSGKRSFYHSHRYLKAKKRNINVLRQFFLPLNKAMVEKSREMSAQCPAIESVFSFLLLHKSQNNRRYV
jgi:hypothetical protein